MNNSKKLDALHKIGIVEFITEGEEEKWGLTRKGTLVAVKILTETMDFLDIEKLGVFIENLLDKEDKNENG